MGRLTLVCRFYPNPAEFKTSVITSPFDSGQPTGGDWSHPVVVLHPVLGSREEFRSISASAHLAEFGLEQRYQPSRSPCSHSAPRSVQCARLASVTGRELETSLCSRLAVRETGSDHGRSKAAPW